MVPISVKDTVFHTNIGSDIITPGASTVASFKTELFVKFSRFQNVSNRA